MDEPQPANAKDPVEGPLRMADTDGSTLPVDEPAQPASDDKASGSAAPASSTGGFDTMLGKIVVQAGLATTEEVAQCTGELEAASEGASRTLADALISHQFVTRHQLTRLRADFDARRSGKNIPGFKITKKLGAGAMATVFLARQISLDRLVAIKILPKKFSNNEKFIERFYKEGRAAAQLNHPNIVGAYDVGRAGDHHYFVMEYVDGPTVYDSISENKRVPEKEALEIVKQVAKALDHAHGRGFVHRDIKPKNVMITKSGRVKLADLGLARAVTDVDAAKAEEGRAYGTPYYISPEQIRGELEIGPPADIYGLGATFFHMVTGRVPFEGKNPSAVMHKHLKEPLQPPDHLNPELSTGCAQIIEMMMSKARKDRYQTVQDLIEDIDLVLQDKPPHFAHRTLDSVAITETLTAAAAMPPAEPKRIDERPSRLEDPVFLGVLAVAAIALIAAVVQAIV